MRLIDAEVLKMGKFHSNESWASVEQVAWQWGWNDAIDAIIYASPTVDAVEVVRCKDCYYCAQEKSFGNINYYCDAFAEHAEGDLIGVSLEVKPNHFCSWGERREDAETD